MKGWIMFDKIKILKEQNLKVTQIARILNSDLRTINKYCNMSSEEFELLRTQHKQRIIGRKIDIYEQLIVSWIKEFNDMLKNLGKNMSYLNSKFHDNILLFQKHKRKEIWGKLIFLLEKKNKKTSFVYYGIIFLKI